MLRRAAIMIGAVGLLAASPLDPQMDVRPVQQGAASPFAAIMQMRSADADREAGKLARAEAAYRAVLALDPTLRDARMGLGETLLLAGRASEARDMLDGLDAPVLRTLIALQAGTLSAPEATLRAQFQRTSDPRLANALGEWLDDRGQGDRARAAFLSAAAYQRPGVAQNNVGLSFVREGRLDRAFAAFDTAVALAPDDPQFARNRRLCALMRGDYVTGLDGISGAQASPLLREAGASALGRGELTLAKLLLTRSQDLAVRHDPRTDALLQQLHRKRADPAE